MSDETAERHALAHLDPRRLRDSGQLRLVRLLPRVHRPLSLVALANLVVNVGIPTTFIVASGRFVGSIPSAVRDGAGSAAADRLWSSLVVLAVVYVSQQVLTPILETGSNALGRRVDEHVVQRVMHAAAGPVSMAHLEESETLDLVAKATGTNTGMVASVGILGLIQTWSFRLVALASGLILLRFDVWLAILLVVVPVLTLGSWQRFFKESLQALFLGTDELRRSHYIARLGMTASSAKELRVFGLGGWVTERFNATWRAAMAPVFLAWASRRKRMLAISVLPGLLQVVALVLIARRGVAGDLSLTEVTIYVNAVIAVVGIGGISDYDRYIAGGAAAIRSLEELEAKATAVAAASTAPADALPAPSPRTAIRFEGLHFTYPGRTTPVFDGLDLDLVAGRSTAIVGVNGAGKTTLVKLLCRLRDPDSGRVTVDGVDLASVDAAGWQRKVAAIFQDFARYNLSARDNVVLGAPEHGDDHEGVVRSAERAGIADAIAALPLGWDTPLDRQRKDGAELSGGQWQRLAIARALFATRHGAEVLILDEPTAALDVRTEADLYDRFLELTAGVTTLVISHRFSTVRRADRIVVVDGGRVVEQGTHAELVAAGGHYAEMFDLQARRFVDGEDEADAEEVTAGA